MKRELCELINGLRAQEEKTTPLEGPDGVLGVIAKLEKEGCPIGDEQAFARLAARFGVQVSAGERSMRRIEGGRLDPESAAQSPPRPVAPPAKAAPLRRREWHGIVPPPAPYKWDPKPVEGTWRDWTGPVDSQVAIALDAYIRLSGADQYVFRQLARLDPRQPREIKTSVALRPPLNYRLTKRLKMRMKPLKYAKNSAGGLLPPAAPAAGCQIHPQVL